MVKSIKDHSFCNWSRTLKFKPEDFYRPVSESEVVEIVRGMSKGEVVRTQGAGHSWSQLVTTNDALVSLDKLNRSVRFDKTDEGPTATVPAGIRLKDLVELLAGQNMGLRNLGSILEQSIAGAVSTATHGTGLRLGNLATQIIGMKIVTGTGDTQPLVISNQPRDRELLRAARVNLGALGIITEVTIQCVPHYDIDLYVYWCKFDDVFQKDVLQYLIDNNERVRLWWLIPPVGDRDDVLLSLMLPEGAKPQVPMAGAPVKKIRKDSLSMNTGDLLSRRVSVSGTEKFREFFRANGNYNEMLTVPFVPIRHRECEYAIDAKDTVEAMKFLRTVVEEGDFRTSLPVEVRFVRNDDSYLSPVYSETGTGGGACYIGINTRADNTKPGANELFARFEPFAKELGGRPHWGKHFTLNKEDVKRMYPAYDKYNAIRKRLDPNGVFANSLIHELFD